MPCPAPSLLSPSLQSGTRSALSIRVESTGKYRPVEEMNYLRTSVPNRQKSIRVKAKSSKVNEIDVKSSILAHAVFFGVQLLLAFLMPISVHPVRHLRGHRLHDLHIRGPAGGDLVFFVILVFFLAVPGLLFFFMELTLSTPAPGAGAGDIYPSQPIATPQHWD